MSVLLNGEPLVARGRLPNMLCDLCMGFIQDLSTGDVARCLPRGWEVGKHRGARNAPELRRKNAIPCRYTHCKTIEDLQDSGNACEMCRYLSSFSKRSFSTDGKKTSRNDLVTVGIRNPGSSKTEPYDSTFSFLLGELKRPRPIRFQIYNPFSDAPSILKYSTDIDGDPRAYGSFSALSLALPITEMRSDGDLDRLINLARVWLDNCSKNHQRCYETKGFIPTRVLDVGPPDGSQDPHLHITTEEDKNKPYVTLSYCWGTQTDKNQNLITETQTLEARRSHIPMKDLPACCQDAVIVSRRLGFRFLWIDALCIIQNQKSRGDWIAESGKMTHIYGHSALTISAGSSDKCSSGFLQPRKPSDVGIEITIQRCGHNETVGIREFPKSLKSALSDSVIARRGWTMQERMLSSRILHFTENQMFWQCAADEHSEDGKKRPEMRSFRNDHRMYQRQDIDRIEVRLRWFEIVDEHKRLELSNHSDRLPSLAGIARAYHRHFNSKYLVGLWAVHLPRNLLWKCIDVEHKSEDNCDVQHATIQGPSWSWANAPWKVRHGDEASRETGSEDMAKVEYATVEADDEDNRFLGQVKNAKIGLHGKLKELRYCFQNWKRWLSDCDQQRHGQHPPEDTFSNNRYVDWGKYRSRLCWGMLISKDTTLKGRVRFNLLLLEERDRSQLVFARCGVADLDNKTYLELFEGATEESIQII